MIMLERNNGRAPRRAATLLAHFLFIVIIFVLPELVMMVAIASRIQGIVRQREIAAAAEKPLVEMREHNIETRFAKLHIDVCVLGQ